MAAASLTLGAAAPSLAAGPPAAGAGEAREPVIHVISTDTPVTNAPSAFATAVSTCPAGSVLVSGGMWGSKVDATDPAPPINGLRAKGTFPSDASGTVSLDGTQDPVFWAAVGNFGGQSEEGDKITSFAVCAEGTALDHRVVSVASVAAPTQVGTPLVTAACPTGTIAVGGGGHTVPPPSASLKAVGSFPSDAQGNPLPDGAANPRYWTARGVINGHADPTVRTYAFAVCADPGDMNIAVVRKDGLGPQEGSSYVIPTATCPTGRHLLGGGQDLLGGALGYSTGAHLRGSYPSDAAGEPALNGTTDPTSWSAVIASGGGGGTTDQPVLIYALCADFTHNTTTSLAADTTAPLFGRPVQLTATVTPGATGVGTPTGSVIFADGGTPLATVALTGGTASFSTAKLQPGAHQFTASYSGGPTMRASATTAPTTVTVGFSQPCLTTTRSGPLTVAANQALCLAAGGRQSGPISIQPGGALAVTGGQISGPLSASRPSALTLCQATVNGPVSVTGATGYVMLGSDHQPCAGNSLSGPLSVNQNTAGLEVSGNTINGPAQITGNGGSGLTAAEATPAFTANRVGGPLSCSGNTPSLRQSGNTANGPRSGQCA
ncbi:Ig-like domain-containing protein [Candidatus Frankia nodulisporulans]|uniref:Ig-like domain-containing protein n=1 Tax=Candidatus Frankia nodulisporulans TaxID=2060052 RepID=UPI0013D68B02|nr:Ig-like domain-containing protein [Candidatus Frankia nodulisporulans]